MTIREKATLMSKLYDAICRNHTGKMEGMWSLSTSCNLNRYCIARHKNGDSICAKCFAVRQTSYQKTLAKKLEKNTELLTKEVIDEEYFPIVPLNIFRLESFGDLNNIIQIQNYFNFAKRNPETIFALWTKNAFLFPEARKVGIAKPDNIIIVESAPFINTPIKPSDIWVDKVFVVWDKSYKGCDFINCRKGDGKDKRCVECQNCYRFDGPKVINEIVK